MSGTTRSSTARKVVAALIVATLAAGCGSNDDNRGDESEAPAADAVSPITYENHLDVVAQVLTVYTGRIYEPAIFIGPAFVDAEVPIAVEIIDSVAGVTRSVYGCTNSGRAIITAYTAAAGAERTLLQSYDDCEWNGWVHEGEVTYRLEPYGRMAWKYERLTLRNDDGHRIAVDGEIRRSFSTCKHDNFDTFSTDLEHFEDTANAFRITKAQTEFAYGVECLEPKARLTGTFTLEPRSDDARTLWVDIPVAFVNEVKADRRFPVGRLEILSADGNAIVLDTADGDLDPETFALTLLIDGQSTTQSASWDEWNALLRLDSNASGTF